MKQVTGMNSMVGPGLTVVRTDSILQIKRRLQKVEEGGKCREKSGSKNYRSHDIVYSKL